MRAICANAGVNSALACRYFGSKEGLYRVVAKRLFGDLGAPLAELAKGVTDAAGWRAAVREWIDDFLFMTIPTEKAQKLWTSSVWAQVSVYALADRKWHASFQPKGAKTAEWRAKVGAHIAEATFASLKFKKGGK